MAGRLTFGLLALLCFVTVNAAAPQSGRTIRVVISVPPGGAIDTLVRVLGDQIGKTYGPTVIVESRPGAAGTIAAETVARATPDGNTLLINTNGNIISSILHKVNFDPLTSFEPICYLVSSPQVLVVNSASPYHTLAELVAAARAKPGELSIATVGPNTTQHLAVERFKQLAGINLTYVPFTGGTPAINAVLGQHVTSALQNYIEVGGQISAGTLRALATSDAHRIPPLPDLPTIAESGYPDFSTDVWFGLVAPAKTPPDMVAQLIDWFRGALLTPEVKSKLAVQALFPKPICGADFADHIRRQRDEFTRLIRELNLKAQ